MISFPKWLLHLEALIVLVITIIIYHHMSYSWIKFGLLFLLPDIFMLGYLIDTNIGATIYNIGHTYLAPFLLWLIFYSAHAQTLLFIPLIWAAHIAFDRLIGYGLKYNSGFKDTHLGKV